MVKNVQKLNFGIVGCKCCVCLLIVSFVVKFVQNSPIMFRRNHLHDSLRAVRWMEMGLSQTDASRHLNVSRSVVQRMWKQFQTPDSVSRRPVPG